MDNILKVEILSINSLHLGGQTNDFDKV